jgi:hypothetical protein
MVWMSDTASLADKQNAYNLASALRHPARPPALVTIDDPEAGRMRGAVPIESWLHEQHQWQFEQKVTTRLVAATFGPIGATGEWMASLPGPQGDRIQLPVAVVVEPWRDQWVRIYHSLKPMRGRHVVRPPLLEPNPDSYAWDVVGDHLSALGAGELDGVIATYDPEGYYQDSSGRRHVGIPALTELYERFFSAGGGILLKACRSMQDGTRSAIEFVCDRWGGVDLPPQAGIVVFTRGPSGRIVSTHMYDDIDAPGS